jgi:hypothetical protein
LPSLLDLWRITEVRALAVARRLLIDEEALIALRFRRGRLPPGANELDLGEDLVSLPAFFGSRKPGLQLGEFLFSLVAPVQFGSSFDHMSLSKSCSLS